MMQLVEKERKLKIAFFLPSLSGGGAERAFLQLSNWLQLNKPVCIDFLTATNAPIAYPDETESAINFISLNSSHVLSSGRGLAAYVSEARPDVILSTLVHANNCVALNLRLLHHFPTKIILREACSPASMLSSRISFKAKIAYRMARYLYRFADGLIAPSQGVANELVKGRYTSTEAISIPNPIDFARISSLALEEVPDHLREIALDTRIPKIAHIGRLTFQKNQALLIRAFALLQRSRPCRLIIMGEGDERASLERLASDLNVRDKVCFTGFLKNPFSLLNRCDAFALTSRFEGMPNVLLQALGCGLPIVSTDCPHGPREIIEQIPNGAWLASVDEAQEIARCLGEALNCQVQKEYIKKYASAFDINVVGNRYWNAIQSIAYS